MNGKAENLSILMGIHGINVPQFIVLRPSMSKHERTESIRAFLSKLPNGSRVAVRSSATQEDSSNASFAGMYATKLRVKATLEDVQNAVEEVSLSGEEKKEVISHYAASRGLESVDGWISVIIQEMVEADLSGVVFSHDLVQRDGYYLVSVSSGTGEGIVGGISSGRLIRVARGLNPELVKEAWLKQVVVAMQSMEHRFRSTSLDVEFAFRDATLYILQCRPMTGVQGKALGKGEEKRLLRRIDSLNTSIASRFKGDVLGDMIDINPVELLGATPTPLDTSIFKYLFADRIVERVRRDMGYDPLNIGLLRVVAGKPYVSMQAAAFSFRPSGIPDRIYERMVSVYRDALAKNPALQSRVEFDVYAMSCGDKLERVMSDARLAERDKELVRNAFASLDSAFVKISESQSEILEEDARGYERQTAFLDNAPLRTILNHVAIGTEMFVRIARLAFYWKNKFEEVYPKESLNDLIAGHIHTANRQLQVDLIACRNGEVSREDLVRRYGHLRPGQFSMFGESYADDPDYYLFPQMERAELAGQEEYAHVFESTREFKNVVIFMQAREQVKFLFSKTLHLFITKLKSEFARLEISERDAARMSWEELDMCLRGLSDPTAKDEKVLPVLLPDVLIPGVTDLKVITFAEAMPSYITNAVVKARVVLLDRPSAEVNIKGALVLLPNADPGYDFVFHSGAVGIVTKVGGPASHMCIRAVELQMPACIGCGESVYQKIASARAAVLDCSTQQIIVLD